MQGAYDAPGIGRADGGSRGMQACAYNAQGREDAELKLWISGMTCSERGPAKFGHAHGLKAQISVKRLGLWAWTEGFGLGPGLGQGLDQSAALLHLVCQHSAGLRSRLDHSLVNLRLILGPPRHTQHVMSASQPSMATGPPQRHSASRSSAFTAPLQGSLHSSHQSPRLLWRTVCIPAIHDHGFCWSVCIPVIHGHGPAQQFILHSSTQWPRLRHTSGHSALQTRASTAQPAGHSASQLSMTTAGQAGLHSSDSTGSAEPWL